MPPTVELAQAFLMTQNLKEAAGRVHSGPNGNSSFMRNEIVGDQYRLHDAMTNVSRLLGNLGSSDMASNFLLEQRGLSRAYARDNKQIRDLIEDKVRLFTFTQGKCDT